MNGGKNRRTNPTKHARPFHLLLSRDTHETLDDWPLKPHNVSTTSCLGRAALRRTRQRVPCYHTIYLAKVLPKR